MGIFRQFSGVDQIAKAALTAAALPTVSKPESRTLSPRDYLMSLSPEAMGDVHPGTGGAHYGLFMAMSQMPVVACIHQTRINQVIDFSRPTDSPHKNGWQIRLRDKRKTPSTKALKDMALLSEVISNAGGVHQVEDAGFSGFLAAITRDSLTYDQVNFEVLYSRWRTSVGKRPGGFVYVDPSTIRRSQPSAEELKAGRLNPDTAAYVQIMDDRVVKEFDRNKMCFGIRRPRSWTLARGYGWPELETLMVPITNLLHAETWNAKKFTTGINADQMLTLSSDMSAEMFEAVRRIVWAMMSGTANNQRVPLLQLSPELNEKLDVHNLGGGATDMQFREWINFLIKIACALYQMDPAELGFVFGNEGQSSSLGQQGPAERIAASKERGLHPLLQSIADWINRMVVQHWDPDYEFSFVGYDEIPPGERLDLDIKAAKVFRSPNEIRAERDEKPIVLMAGDVNLLDLPLDPTLINAALQLAGGGGEEGDGDGEGDGEDGDAPTEEETANAKDALRSLAEGAEKAARVAKASGAFHAQSQSVDDLIELTVRDYQERASALQASVAAG